MIDYGTADATAMAAAVRAGATTPAELLAEARRRADAAGALNAVVQRFDPPPADPGGPFAGVPFLLKDLGAALAGHKLTEGSRYYADYTPEKDDVFVQRLKATGLAIFGKTNTPELGLRPVTEGRLYGAARNPHDPSLTPGGSSGGAAAAVAAGIVPAAHGNDIGGSLRIPASCCGVFGFKPSRGRMPAGPLRLELPGDMNTEGFITLSVRDNAGLLDATMGADPARPSDPPPPSEPFALAIARDPAPLRIGLITGPMWGRAVHPDCRAALTDAAMLLRSLGHTVEEADPVDPAMHRAATRAFLVLLSARLRHFTMGGEAITGLPPEKRLFEPSTWALGLIDSTHPPGAIAAALATVATLTERMAAFGERFDAFLTPTLAAPPLRIGATDLTLTERLAVGFLNQFPVAKLAQAMLAQLAGQVFAWAAFTPLFNMTGQPAMSVPLCTNADGLPVGVQFAGRVGEDGLLLQLAAQLERARPWGRPPALI
jgi:Asp-tRNA(Asn)/Glu-tRNA(Gln) amidotransferase A subunit family amidase